MKKLILLSVITILTSCATASIPIVVKLPLPPALELPDWPVGQLSCLTDDTYTALVQRDQLQIERRTTYQEIIKTTHGSD